jgi:muconate cycloisomerase
LLKITSIETIPVCVPIRKEIAIRSGRGGSHIHSPFLLIKIHTNEGITGLGEVSCTPRWSGEDSHTAAHFIKDYFAPLLVGETFSNPDATIARISHVVAGNYFTKAAIEMALWDIAGKAAQVPVYKLLGGKARETIPTKWSISGVQPSRAAEIAEWAFQQGFRCMKVKVGIDPDEDIARVRAVRNAVGPEVKLGVDANGGWNAGVVPSMIDRLQEFGIYFVEQPVAAQEIVAMSRIRENSPVPIIADESIYTEADARNLAELKACDAFSAYIGKAGGISGARAVAEVAAKNSLGCTIGSNLELGIGSAAMLHLATAVSGINAEDFPCDIIGPFFYEDELLMNPLELTPGFARVPELPGLGIALNDKAVAKWS